MLAVSNETLDTIGVVLTVTLEVMGVVKTLVPTEADVVALGGLVVWATEVGVVVAVLEVRVAMLVDRVFSVLTDGVLLDTTVWVFELGAVVVGFGTDVVGGVTIDVSTVMALVIWLDTLLAALVRELTISLAWLVTLLTALVTEFATSLTAVVTGRVVCGSETDGVVVRVGTGSEVGATVGELVNGVVKPRLGVVDSALLRTLLTTLATDEGEGTTFDVGSGVGSDVGRDTGVVRAGVVKASVVRAGVVGADGVVVSRDVGSVTTGVVIEAVPTNCGVVWGNVLEGVVTGVVRLETGVLTADVVARPIVVPTPTEMETATEGVADRAVFKPSSRRGLPVLVALVSCLLIYLGK